MLGIQQGCSYQKNSSGCDNGGLKLAQGFGATVVAENLGRVRHIAVNDNGDIYAKLERLREGKGIVRLRDSNGDESR